MHRSFVRLALIGAAAVLRATGAGRPSADVSYPLAASVRWGYARSDFPADVPRAATCLAGGLAVTALACLAVVLPRPRVLP